MSIFHDKYDWLGEAEHDVTDAEDAIVRYDDEGRDPVDKDIAFFGVQCAIAKALVEIRDELRIMNEGRPQTEISSDCRCKRCGAHVAFNEQETNFCPACGAKVKRK